MAKQSATATSNAKEPTGLEHWLSGVAGQYVGMRHWIVLSFDALGQLTPAPRSTTDVLVRRLYELLEPTLAKRRAGYPMDQRKRFPNVVVVGLFKTSRVALEEIGDGLDVIIEEWFSGRRAEWQSPTAAFILTSLPTRHPLAMENVDKFEKTRQHALVTSKQRPQRANEEPEERAPNPTAVLRQLRAQREKIIESLRPEVKEFDALLSAIGGLTPDSPEVKMEITLLIRENARRLQRAIVCPKCGEPGYLTCLPEGRLIMNHGTKSTHYLASSFVRLETTDAPPDRRRKRKS